MTGMKAYYLSRGLIAVAMGVFLLLSGSPWWIGIGAGSLAMVWFLFAPRLGRYSVHPGRGVTAVQRDERGEAISNAAARNAFVACVLAVAAADIYTRAAASDAVKIAVLDGILLLAVLVYYMSDFWLRRAQS